MQELITTLEKLLAKNFIDYALVIIPIVISLIAIALSIVTTQKQNRIALFEKRYDAYSNLLKLKAFSQMLIENDYSFSLETIIAAGKIPDIEIKHRCREVLNNFQAFSIAAKINQI